MCQFLSAIVTRDGTVLCEPLIDSHDLLIKHFKVHERPDAAPDAQNFVRVEFRPLKEEPKTLTTDLATDEMALDQPERFRLILDERSAPAWWTEEVIERVTTDLRRRVERMIVRTAVPILVGGCFIVAAGADVEIVGECRVRAVRGGTVNEVRGGTVNAVWGGTVNEVRGGTVNEVWGGTVREIGQYADVGRVLKGATILKDHRPAAKSDAPAQGAEAKAE